MPIPTRIVVPTSVGKLGHQVSVASASPGGRYLVAASSESTLISVFSANGRQVREVDVKCKLDCLTLTIDARAERLAFVEQGSGRLCVFALEKDRLLVVEQESTPVACSFDAKGHLWTIRVTAQGFVIELRAPETAELLASASFSNAYYAAGGAHLRPGASEGSVLVETYSGQSEQEFHLCSLTSDDRLSVEHLPILDGNQQVFLSDEASFAVSLDHSDPGVVRYPLRFDFEHTRIAWPDYAECEDERPGYQCSFLDESHPLVSSSEGRMFVLDSADTEFSSELHVEGHAPVPLSVKYPTLAGPGLVSDLIAFDRCGHSVIAFFAPSERSPAPSYAVLRIAAILGAEVPREAPK